MNSSDRNDVRSVYIHVPFCKHRCGYCDFTLVADRDDLISEYLRALDIELGRAPNYALDTLFFGGGTPTHLSPDQLAQLFESVVTRFTLNDECEFSVEANPDGLTREKIDVLHEYGVNRISLGVQSFDQSALSFLERDHTPGDVLQAVEVVRNRIPNFSLDLIFAVPGQSLVDWHASLDAAIALSPTHLSTYGLTIEKGTAFWSRQRKGNLHRLPDELERDMYAAAIERLPAAGFTQYEISNFARAGFNCRHNEVYWSGLSYDAFGPGAACFISGRRETNHRSVTGWLKRVLAGKSPIGDSEQLAPEDHARELLVLGLRRTAGVDKPRFLKLTGYTVDALTRGRIDSHLAAKHVVESESMLRLTRAGRFFADAVVVDLL
ncbi:MAG: radical SAM family heme chaperone HemW [Planctomycetota bacterium]|nr:radical SAM family heme chaperone HemW [Planctomycetota bacterium]